MGKIKLKNKSSAPKKMKIGKVVHPKATEPISDDEESEEPSNLFDEADEGNDFDKMSENDDGEQGDEDVDSENDDGAAEDEFVSHKQSLEKLKETDPDFYKFLQENDKKLLQFNLSDEEDDDDEKEEGEDEDGVHVPSGDLVVDSDEDDYEAEDEEPDNKVITLRMLKQWRVNIEKDKSNKTITCLIRAFHAAMNRVSTDADKGESHYKVDGSSVFNAIIQLCVLELGPAIRRFLGLPTGSEQPPHKCKKFVKVKTLLRGYFADLLKLLSSVTSSNILIVLLKHLHYMSTLTVSFPNLSKPLLKRLITLWGTSEESVRVIAFLCILRITHRQQTTLLDSTLKMMYMTYVKNAKFVSTGTLPNINFMRRSLVEMFALDLNVSYQHVFLYIRQLAIHLRNAITVNKKENLQAVYNWQFVNSLRLWGNLLSATHNKPQLQTLVYPFVQVCLGTIKLVPTTQYYPLRFHVTDILIQLSKDTDIFVNILPFVLEVLTGFHFNKKHQKVSMKPLHFTCILRLSKSQMSENGFKDTLIETIYGQILEYMAIKSHTTAFPELSLFTIIQLKQFAKSCSIAKYSTRMKQLMDRVEQNSKFVENQRNKLNCTLVDLKAIEAFETNLKNESPPLMSFYEQWNKLRMVKKRKQATDNEKLGDYNLPLIKKVNKQKSEGDDEKVTLFPSDSESESEAPSPKRKRGKRAGKKYAKTVVVDDGKQNDSGDVVEDFNVDDW